MKCRLCRSEFKPEEESHIIPSFVFRWLKKTSATGYIRHSEQINRRPQDGLKCHFLCGECEDLFGKFETEFSKRIFHPYVQNDTHHTEYCEYFLRFSTSCIWRVLEYTTQEGLPPHFRGRHSSALSEAKEKWRKYLIGENEFPEENTIHCLPVSGVISSDMKLPDRINRYYMRAIGGDVACSNTEAFVYVKLGPFILFGLIAYPDPTHWVGTKIDKNGTFRPHDTVVPHQFGEYIHGIAAQYNEVEDQMSEKQKKIIYKSYEKDEGRVLDSDTMKAMLYEEELKKHNKSGDEQ